MTKELQDGLQAAAWMAGSVGLFVTGLSAFLAYRIFKADHDRSRKAEVLKLLLLWNDNVLKHRRAIEARFPGLLDKDDRLESKTYLTDEHAREIYLAKSDKNPADWELRFHLIELINFLESISVAYLCGIADRVIIDESFKPTIVNYSLALRNFATIVEKCRGHNPWAPYTRLLKYWNEPVKPPIAYK